MPPATESSRIEWLEDQVQELHRRLDAKEKEINLLRDEVYNTNKTLWQGLTALIRYFDTQENEKDTEVQNLLLDLKRLQHMLL